MMKRKLLALLLACLMVLPAASNAQDQVQYTLDFDYMRHFASNAAGWLYQPGTTIDSPILYTSEGYFYLTHGFDSRYSRTGAVYVLSEEMPDFSDPIVILRGRNNMDDSLFGSLSLYQKPEYYQKHPTLYLISPEGSYQLDIFAGVKLKHRDHETWVITPDEDRMADRLPGILEASFLTPDAALLPNAEDDWAILTTEDAKSEGSRFILYARKRLLPPSDAPVVYMNQQGMDARKSVSGYATAEGVATWMVYGQNDPLWDRMVFEVANSSRRRPFGDGGCGPTSVAIAIANLVPAEKLPKIGQYASSELGYVFCPCCIGTNWCDVRHLPYQLKTPEEYLRYFPLAVADFAMGNNVFGVQGRHDSYGTNMTYLEAICSVYGLSFRTVRSFEEAMPFLRRKDTMAVCSVSGTYSPFTNNSHFLVLAHVDDEYVYVLDPLRRESYAEMDIYGVVELISPGLVRVKLENASRCHFSGISLLTY